MCVCVSEGVCVGQWETEEVWEIPVEFIFSLFTACSTECEGSRVTVVGHVATVFHVQIAAQWLSLTSRLACGLCASSCICPCDSFYAKVRIMSMSCLGARDRDPIV